MAVLRSLQEGRAGQAASGLPGLLPSESAFRTSPIALTLGPPGEEEGGVAARLSGWQGRRAVFLGIVWGKHIVRASLQQAATGLWGCLLVSPVLSLGEGAGTEPAVGWPGTFQETLP